ncbi:MAG: hypothetical protein M3N82_15005 [Pseudomonadota bacterium]|nr:hypothetical protein [Pseudomonadota bacterium]
MLDELALVALDAFRQPHDERAVALVRRGVEEPGGGGIEEGIHGAVRNGFAAIVGDVAASVRPGRQGS